MVRSVSSASVPALTPPAAVSAARRNAPIAPVVDVFSVYGLIFLNPVKVIGFWTGFVLLQAIAGGYALRLDGERLRSLWLLPLQQVVYRQLMYLVTIQSVITALLGTRQPWQVIRRAGVFAGQPDTRHKVSWLTRI